MSNIETDFGIQKVIQDSFTKAWSELRAESSKSELTLDSHESYRKRIIGLIPERFGKVKPNTPMYDLINAISATLAEHDKEQRIVLESHMRSVSITAKDMVKDVLREAIKEEVASLLKDKSAAETEAFLSELEAL